MYKNLKILVWIGISLYFNFGTAQDHFYAKNSSKFEDVLEHYKLIGDKEKLNAANFLIDNLDIHKSVKCNWENDQSEILEINELDFENIENYFARLEQIKKDGFYPKLNDLWDTQFLTSDFLIDAIDTAFEGWKNSPWGDAYSFEVFCEYVLPYRNAVEPIRKNWRSDYEILYKNAVLDASDSKDPVEVCIEVLRRMEHFAFIPQRDYPQPLLSVDQMHFRRIGSCPDLANTALLSCRAIGLATTFDFTPFHAASSNSHFWNTIIDNNGEHIPFNSNQKLPYEYNATHRRLGKILRQTFSKQKNTLPNFMEIDQIPGWALKMQNILDVTEEYVSTIDITYRFQSIDTQNIGYLTVFNKGQWKPIWWGKITANGEVVFRNMGTNIVYLPCLGEDDLTLNLEKYPIHIGIKGNQRILEPDFKNSFNCQVSRTNELIDEFDDFNTVKLNNNEKYYLYYWEKKWKLLSQQVVLEGNLAFEGLPSNALFKLEPEMPDGFERIFTLEKDTCTIYWY